MTDLLSLPRKPTPEQITEELKASLDMVSRDGREIGGFIATPEALDHLDVTDARYSKN